MIYLASPYSHPDPIIRKTRFLLAEQATAGLLTLGFFPYSPIVHCHELAEKYYMAPDFSFWRDYNIDMLRRADAFYILRIEGWAESKGVTHERGVAHLLNIPETFVDENGQQIG